MTAIKAFKIGAITIANPMIQAALSGYSDWPMRSMARHFGASYTLCEVMLDHLLVTSRKKSSKNRYALFIGEDEHPIGGQLMGAEPAQFAAGAMILCEAGFDVIDINFGCPVKKVLGRCRGGYHLSQPAVALEIIRRTRDCTPSQIPVTVKMRIGIDTSNESRDKFYQIIDGAFAAGVAAVTVHGRTVQQGYNGPSDWDFLRQVKQSMGDQIIIGSGDLFSAQDCLDMMTQTGVDGVTVARGAIGNPWIFQQAQAMLSGKPLPEPPSLFAQKEVLQQHYQYIEQLYGAMRGPIQMRKFGVKYAALHPEYKQVRAAFVSARSTEEWQQVLQEWYAEDLPGCFPSLEIHKV